MNWHVSIPMGSAALFEGRARGAYEDTFSAETPGSQEPTPEVREQFEAALTAAQYVLRSVQPNQDGPVAGRLSGYATPGHEGSPGANDSVGISVYVPDSV